MNVDYMNLKIKNEFVDKYFKNLIQTSDDEIVEIGLEDFVNKMNELKYI